MAVQECMWIIASAPPRPFQMYLHLASDCTVFCSGSCGESVGFQLISLVPSSLGAINNYEVSAHVLCLFRQAIQVQARHRGW